ncbi:MAG TPA: cupin domain-containing protein [Dehalococcoidia bacterium]|nr:cupin domain-containing protein [Dehalococcoidia bacterium]HIK88876.1 cupin domain-containing protein [Dehalococcoidia bacterium]
MIIRRSEQEAVDRYPGCPRFAIIGADFGHTSLHVGDLSYLPGHGVPHHYHTGGAEETQIMLEGELECWVDGKRVTVYPGDTVTAAPGIGHAFQNRSDKIGRMITAFPLTSPETVHIDDPELEDADEHPAIIRAESRRMPYAVGVEGVDRIELSGDFSGAKSTYTYFVDIQPGAVMPVETQDAETALFVVSSSVVSVAENKYSLATDDGAGIPAGEAYGFANQGDEVARLCVVHPFLNS